MERRRVGGKWGSRLRVVYEKKTFAKFFEKSNFCVAKPHTKFQVLFLRRLATLKSVETSLIFYSVAK
jgi:hypothetical protein